MPRGDWSLLRGLADEERTRVLERTRRRTFARNEVIFHEGDPGDALFLLERGRVALRVATPLGDVATLSVLGPGASFGEGALLHEDSRRSATAIACEPVEARCIGRGEFDELRNDHPGVDRVLIEALGAQLRRTTEHLVEALYVSADKRVLRRLLTLVADSPSDADGVVAVPFTQDELASMAGTTRATANRVLRAAEQAGALALRRGRVDVRDVELLQRRAR
ncbi:MAG TPA: Crp/Fnr family transcriptional regulator [Acidimicrobiia bacterium]|nr:Crp/Fnr family transcriptional regulator [Acidimicrobiia bacterium]